jgi:hypothetical protein
VAGEGGFGLMKNPGEKKKGLWWSRGKKDMPIQKPESGYSIYLLYKYKSTNTDAVPDDEWQAL